MEYVFADFVKFVEKEEIEGKTKKKTQIFALLISQR